jgi:hypothetical protein
MTESEGKRNNISGSERLSPKTWPLPASETEAPSGGEGGGITNGGEGDAQICNETDDVPEERMEAEGKRNIVSGSERLSLTTRTLPASETEAGIKKRMMKKEETVNKITTTMMGKMGVMAIMVMMMTRRIILIIMRTAEMMTMRVMVIIMRMVDRFVEHCKEAVQSSRKQTPNGKGTKSRGRRDYNLGQYCPQRCHLLAPWLETLCDLDHPVLPPCMDPASQSESRPSASTGGAHAADAEKPALCHVGSIGS